MTYYYLNLHLHLSLVIIFFATIIDQQHYYILFLRLLVVLFLQYLQQLNMSHKYSHKAIYMKGHSYFNVSYSQMSNKNLQVTFTYFCPFCKSNGLWLTLSINIWSFSSIAKLQICHSYCISYYIYWNSKKIKLNTI